MSEKRAFQENLLRLSFSLHSLARGALLLLLDVPGSPGVVVMLGGDQWRLIFDIVIVAFTLSDG